MKKASNSKSAGRMIGSIGLGILLLSCFLIVILCRKGTTAMQTTFKLHTDLSQTCFTNDLGVTDIGDPFVLKVAPDEYYMYCTSAPTTGYYCWKSSDLVHWGDKKMCYVRKPDSWCTDCFWAPEVVARDGKYYMYYTAKNRNDSLRIGLAVSDAPDGPFVRTYIQPAGAVEAAVLRRDGEEASAWIGGPVRLDAPATVQL